MRIVIRTLFNDSVVGNRLILISTHHRASTTSSAQSNAQLLAAKLHHFHTYSRSALYSRDRYMRYMLMHSLTCVSIHFCLQTFFPLSLSVSLFLVRCCSFPSAFFFYRIARSSFTSNKFSQYFKRLYQIELRQLLFASFSTAKKSIDFDRFILNGTNFHNDQRINQRSGQNEVNLLIDLSFVNFQTRFGSAFNAPRFQLKSSACSSYHQF